MKNHGGLVRRIARLTRSVWEGLLGRLDFQKDIVGPVIEKLILALVIFTVLATCKEWLYPMIWPQPSDANYPIFATGEAFSQGRLVEGEIYVVNLTGRALSENAQREWLEQRKGSNPSDVDPQIYVRWLRDGSRMTLTEDVPFNQGKGRLELSESPGDKLWRIRVKDINGAAMLRVKLTTDYEATLTRNDKLSLPFRIESPRSIDR